MTDSGGTANAGWFHAEGDPPGTHRYWNGSAWEGEPQPVAPSAPTAPAAPAPPSFTPPPSFGPPGAAGPRPAFGGPVAAAPEKKSNWWKWVLGLGALFVLGVGGCSYAVFRAVSGPIDVGNEYLAALEARDYDEAWELSDPSCFSEDGPGPLAQALGSFDIVEYRLTSSNVNSTNGVTTGATSGTVTLAGDDQRTVEILATKSGDDWRVCGININEAGG